MSKNWALSYQNGELEVVTCAVDDGPEPFETGVSHPEYNHHRWVIVDTYLDKEKAERGHWEWVTKMTQAPPPELEDVGKSMISRMLDKHYGNRQWRTMVRHLPHDSSLSN